jgi:glycosyltransferase involved in cell wall biosynthesis
MEKYIDWGIPRDKIRFEDYGRRGIARVAGNGSRSARNRFGFFGQFTPFKGADVLMEAMDLLASESVDAHLCLHGANLEYQPQAFQKRFKELLARTSANVTMIGRYAHEQLPQLMSEIDWVIVPSIWWENSPLVIQEAFAHGRPVICSDIGGMKEKVRDGVDGLHFAAGDAASLARTIAKAASTPGLWDRLAAGIAPIYDIAQQVRVMENLYDKLRTRAEVMV